MRLRLLLLVVLTIGIPQSFGQTNSTQAAIHRYVESYVSSGNFAGVVLVAENGRVTFQQPYGFADRENGTKNSDKTQFHIASVSMQFTAAAVLRLVDRGSLDLNDTVDKFVPGIEGDRKITIRDLLTQRSGLQDINALPGYEEVLQHHQTPESLVKKVGRMPLLFEPGSKYLHEEHSAYNLLALIVEKKSGIPFFNAAKRLVFQPLGLTSSGVDDDSAQTSPRMARGYEPEGTTQLKLAKSIHWSGKTGNGSAYTTAGDLARWVNALFNDDALSVQSRNVVLDTSVRVGYGWFRGEIKRLGRVGYYMNGRAPGFSSFVLYVPDRKLTVVILSNIYSSATSAIGYDIAALTLGLPYSPLKFREGAVDPKELESCTGSFQFGSDFYVPNATVTVRLRGRELSMQWPDGHSSVLIPLDRDHFVDRSYWEKVQIERGSAGHASGIVYGDFRGTSQ